MCHHGSGDPGRWAISSTGSQASSQLTRRCGPRMQSGAWADTPGRGQRSRGTTHHPSLVLARSLSGSSLAPALRGPSPGSFPMTLVLSEPRLQPAARPPYTGARQALSTVRVLQILRRADPPSPSTQRGLAPGS